MSVGPGDQPRSLADDLRVRDDAELAELLRARPDVMSPVPSDVGQLAARATTQASVTRALDRLNRFLLQVVDVLVALPDPTTAEHVRRWLGADPGEALEELRRLGLLWGPPDALHLVGTVSRVVGAPAGLGPPLREALGAYGPRRLAQLLADAGLPAQGDPVAAVAALAGHLSEQRVLDALLEAAPAESREVLDRLRWGPPYGRLPDAFREVTAASAATPVEWLLARGLLVATEVDAVTLPREIAVRLRGGRVHDRPVPRPPTTELTRRDPALVDRTAGTAAFTVLRHVEDLLESWGLAGPSVLRAGGLGVRDLKRTAGLLDVDEPHAAFVVEMAYCAGLVGGSGQLGEQWLPTPEYDAWRAKDPPIRWATLAGAWLETTRVAGLVGARDERGRAIAPLGPDLDRAVAPEVRSAVLAEVVALPPGAAAAVASVDARVQWRRPRRGGRLRADLVRWTLREAELLGVTGLGAASPAGRALLGGDRGAAASAMARLLPEPVDHLLLQADLTAVAPGPLEPALAHELALMADVASRGGATVYRFTEASVRRALDCGRSAADLHAVLDERSRTPVPQPLTYLVDDVARRHGRVRVGTAQAYVRCDDEAALSELLADRRALDLRLRRLAPTVVAAHIPADSVLATLRELGYAPMAETPDGDLVVRRPDSRRTLARQRPPRLLGEPPTPDDAMLAAAVRALRAGDRAARVPRLPLAVSAPPGALPRSAPKQTLTALQAAVTRGTPVWIGYTNNDGQTSQRVIEPIRVEGGYVTAFDHLREEVRTFAVHRITGVAAVG